ncbi:hypothetical protein [Cupriavidus sp. AcVe19-1a]|uniref:hypothetical protein n=1 Tax=Cupriavidus sp. AcVe19-1a TaxID=2821359 RepID=UPI001AE36D57|nr:hypothetical protein [Cupriavidus sp. AcVe19-1a]
MIEIKSLPGTASRIRHAPIRLRSAIVVELADAATRQVRHGNDNNTLRQLLVASEIFPLARTGGLAAGLYETRPKRWSELRELAMSSDFAWARSAACYACIS